MSTEAQSIVSSEAAILRYKDDVLRLEVDPAFIKHNFGGFLKQKLIEDSGKHTKKVKEQAGERRYEFFELTQLAQRIEPERGLDFCPQFFFKSPVNDRTALYELVYNFTMDPRYFTETQLEIVFGSSRMRLQYERFVSPLFSQPNNNMPTYQD